MSATDNPLKSLITNTREAFASWLLDRPVTSVQPLNVEFTARGVRSDLLFMVEDHPRTILHLELQGPTSYKPMPLRELEYLSRTVDRDIGVPTENTPRLHSVVLYVGNKAGAKDTGRYEIQGIGQSITLRWQYQVVHLWKMTPQWLEQIGNPALLALAGQTQLTEPSVELPQTLKQINRIENDTLRHEVAGAFMSLLPSKEIVKMMEAYLEQEDDWVQQLPYLQMLRERAIKQGHSEGIQQGIQQGLQQGIQQGLQQGIQQGIQQGLQQGEALGLRNAILDIVGERFNPVWRDFQQFRKQLDTLTNSTTLQTILRQLLTSASMVEANAMLENAIADLKIDSAE